MERRVKRSKGRVNWRERRMEGKRKGVMRQERRRKKREKWRGI